MRKKEFYRIYDSKYIRIENGSQGTVYQAKNKKDGKNYAIKILIVLKNQLKNLLKTKKKVLAY